VRVFSSQLCVFVIEGVSAITSIYRPSIGRHAIARRKAYVALAHAGHQSTGCKCLWGQWCSVRACPAGGGTPTKKKQRTLLDIQGRPMLAILFHTSNLGLLRRLTQTKRDTMHACLRLILGVEALRDLKIATST